LHIEPATVIASREVARQSRAVHNALWIATATASPRNDELKREIMKLGRLNHIGVATPSIADSIAFYRDVMGATKIHAPFDLEEQGVKVCFVDTPGADGAMNGTQIELIEPLGENSTLAGFIAKRRARNSRRSASASSAPRASARTAPLSFSSIPRTWAACLPRSWKRRRTAPTGRISSRHPGAGRGPDSATAGLGPGLRRDDEREKKTMSYETIRVDREGPLLTITLNRPERLNAMPPAMADELGQAFYDLGDARAVLITGEGKGFCSGADLSARGSGSALGGKGGSHEALINHYNPAVSQLIRAQVPVICAVNGPAAGVGCSLALAADFTIAAKSAYFLQAFVNIGLVPDGGSTWLLARAIGRARATRMMMLGEKISGTQAEEWGLIYKCVDDADLITEARALAEKLANGPTVAYATMKRNIATALDQNLQMVLLAEAEGQRIAGATKDAMEGGMAFLQKRKAEFKGE
jgi:2-(1,2-epoxy-1,2-dihydrophenyl)acetyl-CoA isomerase